MVESVTSHLVDRLRRAEEAESEVNRLESLAAEAPGLRLELARTQRRQEREENKPLLMKLKRRSNRQSSAKLTFL